MPRAKRLTDEQRQRIIELRGQGLTYPQIAKRVGTNKSSIQRVVANVDERLASSGRERRKPGPKPKATNGHAAPAPVAAAPVEPSTRVAWAPSSGGFESLQRELADVRAERDDLRRLLARMLKRVEV